MTEISTALAMIHGIGAQACFCLAALAALVTSRAWSEIGTPVELRSGRALPRLALIGTAAIFIQLILGAALRHFSGGHALVAHVLWALPVVFLTGWIVMWVLGLGIRSRLVSALAQGVGLLVMVQLMLGGLSWLATLAGTAWSPWIIWVVPSAHVGVGALLLAGSVLLTTVVHRVLGTSAHDVRQSAFVVPAA